MRPLPAFVLAWLIFVLAALLNWGLSRALGPVVDAHRFIPHALMKTFLVALAFLAMWKASGGRARWGLVRPRDPRWGRVILGGALLGAAATALIIVTPARGMPWLYDDLGFGGIVLWIWFYSSITEEIFVRGWFQGLVPAGGSPIVGRLSPAVLWSGVLFGSLHLSILTRGADPYTVVIVVAATTLLGIVAAGDRERTGSVGPPIARHIAFNVGGAVAGIISAILTRSPS